MKNTLVVTLIIGLFMMRPISSYADWHHDGGGHGRDFGHHDRSFIGVNFSVWPDNYYYYGAPYYSSDAVLVSPPIDQQAVEVIQPPTVMNSQEQIPSPVVTTASTTSDIPDSITINIPNNRGGYTAVTLKKSGNGFIGPQGEFYPEFPKVSQLEVIYGK